MNSRLCAICLNGVNFSDMFSVDGCLHRLCVSCLKKHVKAKLHQGTIPNCPFDGCGNELKLTDSCRKVLTSELIEMMSERIKEARIPPTERIYCPHPRCSTLMSKSETEMLGFSNCRKCVKCYSPFCVTCKVPWHENMSCFDYNKINSTSADALLNSLASKNLWRQCTKCSHMIELSAGCFHITCRCGYEFCYTCGLEWGKNDEPTCTCPRWEERYIIHD